MSSKKEEDIAIWLCDAYAKKVKTVAGLEKQVKQTSAYPYFQNNAKEHLEEIKRHAELFKSCLNRYKYPPSASLNKTKKNRLKHANSYKSDMAFVVDVYKSYTEKNDSALSYQAIREAAEDLGDKETVQVCDEILDYEKMTEDWRLAVGVIAKKT